MSVVSTGSNSPVGGWAKARQMKKQASIAAHQKKISKLEKEIMEAKQPHRLKEAIRLSNALGEPSQESVVDKIMDAAVRKAPEPKEDQTFEEADAAYAADICLRRSMVNPERELLLPQMKLESFPDGMGDTLFIQTGFLRSLSVPLNNLPSMLSYRIPALSVYHLRYLKSLNLAGNKIGKLPNDFGLMSSITYLDLSMNSFSILPISLSCLTELTTLNLAKNLFAKLTDEMGRLPKLEVLDLTANLFNCIPSPITRLEKLRILNIARNTITHMGILPALLKPEDMWITVIDHRTGKNIFQNILTKEKVSNLEDYEGKGIEKAKDLHVFQNPGSRSYRRRKLWLSTQQVSEWDPEEDPYTGFTYYRNNVSGLTSWEMPPELDTIGLCPQLEEFIFNNNALKSMAPSFANLNKLKKCILTENRIHDIPFNTGNMEALEVLSVQGNDIKLLPVSLCECKNLKILQCQGNQLIRLPDLIGTLPLLKTIDASSNRMTSLPFSIGYSNSLKDLMVQENPLIDPKMEEVEKGIMNLKWYLRQRLIINKQGLPPAMEFHEMSIQHEVTILKPDLSTRILYLISCCYESGFLNLQLMGIKEFPREIVKMKNVKELKRLRFDFNSRFLFDERGMPIEMAYLKLLSFKCCKIPSLPENIYHLKKLTTFILEENLLESLPKSFTKLKNLTFLDLSRNRLYQLPTGFESLEMLKTLNLESNFIEELPPGLSKLTSLVNLNLSKNRINDIPKDICVMTDLKKLTLEKNCLKSIPAGICDLELVDFRIGFNLIENLREDLFSGALGQSCKWFSCAMNNLLELPLSLSLVDVESTIQADFNPLRSPPPYLLTEGFKVVQNYLYIRRVRLKELEELLTDEDFVFDTSAVGPTSCEVFEDGTGFLTPDDLSEFDQAVDEYLNGEYYKCPSTGVEIVNAIVELRDFRETELYLTICNTFISVIQTCFVDSLKRWSKAVIFTQERSWGRNGEKCNVWVVSLHALLRENPPNIYQKTGRPSILELVKEKLPLMPFPFTIDLLKDSLRIYQSPYGQVADTEQVTSPICDCIDDVRLKPLRHPKCNKACVVICKTIYVNEEAERRNVEEEEFLMRFEEINGEIRLWILTKEGKELLLKEIKKRLLVIQEDISLREELQSIEELKASNLRREIFNLNTRKQQFEDGEDYEVHRLGNIGDAINQIAIEEVKLEKAITRYAAIKAQIESLISERESSITVRKIKLTDILVEKYCGICVKNSIKKFRMFADENNLRRPWDGHDGEDYAEWLRKFHGLFLDTKLGSDIYELTKVLSAEEEDSDEKAVRLLAESRGIILSEYNWDGCENMEKFYTSVYTRYKASKTFNNLASAAMAFTQDIAESQF